MVRFRRAMVGTDATWRWDDGGNAIAFSRGDRGFVALNRGATAVRMTTTTGLVAGDYCDVLAGGRAASGCAGARVTVGPTGGIDLTLPASTALVLQTGVQP
jgi:alpha-amylase